jgi:hypothetical protein
MNFNTSRSSFNQSPIFFHLTPELGKRILEMLNNEVEIYRFFCSCPGFSDSFLLSASWSDELTSELSFCDLLEVLDFLGGLTRGFDSGSMEEMVDFCSIEEWDGDGMSFDR